MGYYPVRQKNKPVRQYRVVWRDVFDRWHEEGETWDLVKTVMDAQALVDSGKALAAVINTRLVPAWEPMQVVRRRLSEQEDFNRRQSP